MPTVPRSLTRISRDISLVAEHLQQRDCFRRVRHVHAEEYSNKLFYLPCSVRIQVPAISTTVASDVASAYGPSGSRITFFLYLPGVFLPQILLIYEYDGA